VDAANVDAEGTQSLYSVRWAVILRLHKRCKMPLFSYQASYSSLLTHFSCPSAPFLEQSSMRNQSLERQRLRGTNQFRARRILVTGVAPDMLLAFHERVHKIRRTHPVLERRRIRTLGSPALVVALPRLLVSAVLEQHLLRQEMEYDER
jgi:hypothetical protein